MIGRKCETRSKINSIFIHSEMIYIVNTIIIKYSQLQLSCIFSLYPQDEKLYEISGVLHIHVLPQYLICRIGKITADTYKMIFSIKMNGRHKQIQ